MLFNSFKIEEILLSKDKFFPFPKPEDLSCSKEIQIQAVQNAEKYIENDWGNIDAASYMQFSIDGNRTNYEDKNFARRQALGCLVIGEYIENKGRFLNDIINGIWCICEESTWVLPAHNNSGLLPDITKPIVDLFAAQTGALLALTVYLLREKIDNISKLVCNRVDYEISNRINDPVLNNNFDWMGFGEYRRSSPSNWTAWCGANCLVCCLMIECDEQKRIDIVKKLLEILEYYISSYSEDGGCDEGANYWEVSAGCMFESLELLYRATDKKLNIFNNEKIKKMGEYICKAHIGGEYFINFADCSAKADAGGARTYLFGKRVKSQKLSSFGASDYKALNDKTLPTSMNMLYKLFSVTEVVSDFIEDISIDEQIYFSNLQVFKIRKNDFVLCAKGGHNGDNHNHNDVGSYMVYHKNKPIVIDVGVESYTKKTFSDERYTIWTMQSAYHNLPTINNVMQRDGKQYCAKDIELTDDYFEYDISGAYPEEADLSYWKRRVSINVEEVIIEDDFRVNKPTDLVEISVMTHREPDIRNNDIKAGGCVFSFNYGDWTVEKEKINIKYDAKLTPVWGACVYRLIFKSKKEISDGNFTIKIRSA